MYTYIYSIRSCAHYEYKQSEIKYALKCILYKNLEALEECEVIHF